MDALREAVGNFRVEIRQLDKLLFDMVEYVWNPDELWDLVSDYICDGRIVLMNREIPKLLSAMMKGEQK